MQIYEDKDDIKIVQHVASASTLISSMTGEAKEYLLSKFPPNFFKSTYVDSSETINEQMVNQKYNPKLNKKAYPSLSITPEISLDDPIGGMGKSLYFSSTNLFLTKDLRRSYRKLLADPEHKFDMYFTADYTTVNFNCKIFVNKYIQNIDLAYYIKSRFQQDFFQFVNDTVLNAELPKTFVRALANYKNLDISNEEDMGELEDFLASASTQNSAILRKTSMSTGKDCFFFGSKVNMLFLFTDLDCPPSITRNQMSEAEYTISFRLQVSAWLPNSFIFSVNKSVFEKLEKRTIKSFVTPDQDDEMNDGFYSTSLNAKARLGRQLQISYKNSSDGNCIGHEILNKTITFDLNDPKKEISLMQYLKPDAKKIHAYLMANSARIDDVFRIVALDKNNNANTMVDIDYETLTVKINSDLSEDFMVSLYLDRTAFDALNILIEKDIFFFNKNALALIGLNFNGMNHKARVFGFMSDSEMSSGDLNKMLRVQTIYGIGYINLTDENKKKSSSYKICLGQNITKSIEII